MATAKLYIHTGYDAVNLPYDKASLEKAASSVLTLPPLDLIQVYELNSVRVKAFEAQIMDADYLELSMTTDGKTYTAFYVVSGYHMTSMDVAELDIVPDPTLTCGGVGNITPITGTFSRYGGKRSASGPDAKTMLVDTLMTPSVRAMYKYKAIGDYTQHMPSNGHYLVASSIDLTAVPDSALDQTVAYTYDDTTGELKYSFVTTPSIGTAVFIKFPAELGGGMVSTMTPGYGIYDYSNAKIEKAVQALRAYGYESSIIGVYRVPDEYMESAGGGLGDGHTVINDKGFFNSIACQADTYDTGFKSPASLYDEADLKTAAELLPFSPAYQIGLLSTATGAQIQRRLPDVTGKVIVFADPRPDGGPIFVLQNRPCPTDASEADLAAYRISQIQTCSIQGATWDEVPILYTGASGSRKNYMRLTMSEKFSQVNYENFRDNNIARGTMHYLGKGLQTAAAVPDIYTPLYGDITVPHNYYYGYAVPNSYYNDPRYGTKIITGKIGYQLGDVTGAMGSSHDMLTGLYDTAARDEFFRNQRYQASKRNMQEYALNNILVAPQLTGQMVEGIQQYLGNGCVAYVIYPDAKDLRKYAAISAAYGYAVDEVAHAIATPAGEAVFVKGAGVSILTGDVMVPNGVRDDVGELLNVGARFWTGRPKKLDINSYVNGGAAT